MAASAPRVSFPTRFSPFGCGRKRCFSLSLSTAFRTAASMSDCKGWRLGCNEKNADQGAGNVTEANFTDAYRSCHCLKIQSQTARRLKRYYTVRVFICEFARTNLKMSIEIPR